MNFSILCQVHEVFSTGEHLTVFTVFLGDEAFKTQHAKLWWL